MIGTVIYSNWLHLKRDRVALGLSFVLPVVFFSIFAMIFGGMSGGGSSGPRAVRVAVVDQDQSTFSKRLLQTLANEEGLNLFERPSVAEGEPEAALFTRETATATVRAGKMPVALVLPPGFGEKIGLFGGGEGVSATLIHDPSNPMARFTLNGLLQASVMTAAPDLLMDQGLEMLATYGGPLTPAQQKAADAAKIDMNASDESEDGASSGGMQSLVAVEMVDVREIGGAKDEEQEKGPDIIAYYAAGIGVMFLLFSMSGAAGTLLEEEESGTLDRLLISRLGMDRLVLGKWLFFAMMGFAQLAWMFIFGEIVFGISLFNVKNLSGFLLMSLPCALAASAFGLMLATLSNSRAQLSGMSTIVILIMSALGGSMVPRFAMPAFMDTTAKFTFNGWAIDGYLKIFWRADPDHSVMQALIYLLPEVGVLSAMTALFIGMALFLARRKQYL